MLRRSVAPAALVALAVLASACRASGDDAAPTAASTSPVTSSSPTTAEIIDDPSAETVGEDPTADEDPAAGEGDGPADEVDRWPQPLASLDPDEPARWTVTVLATAPHDPSAFTQGLEELDDGRLLESTGIRGISDLRIVDPATGAVEVSARLDAEEFGEGVTVVGDTAVQLTWQEGVARRWSLPALEPLVPFSYEGEGWGLCHLDDRVAMTDGSSRLTWRDPDSFSVVETVEVRLDGVPIESLNELECVDGHILANVLRSSDVMVIRPDGAVVAVIDASVLVESVASVNPDREVLNGIAALTDGTFTLTGKLWPTRFVVRIMAS